MTLEEGGMTSLKLKLVDTPLKLPVVTVDPPFHKVTPVMEEVLPDPVSDNVKLVRVTGAGLLFVSWICWTGTLEAPANWLELPGGLAPAVACTVTAVTVGVKVEVGVEVFTGVLEAVGVGVEVNVGVGVPVGVEEGV